MRDLRIATIQAVKSAMEWWDEDVHGDLEAYIATCAIDAVRANLNIEAAALDRHRNGRPKCYEGPKEDGCYCWDTTEKAVKAALTPGDPG